MIDFNNLCQSPLCLPVSQARENESASCESSGPRSPLLESSSVTHVHIQMASRLLLVVHLDCLYKLAQNKCSAFSNLVQALPTRQGMNQTSFALRSYFEAPPPLLYYSRTLLSLTLLYSVAASTPLHACLSLCAPSCKAPACINL